MTRKNLALRDDVKFHILRLLQKNPELTQRDLARAVGISVGSMHYCLNALIEKGLIKFSNFRGSEDKRRYAYILTPSGFVEKAVMTAQFLAKKRDEYNALKAEIECIQSEMLSE